MIPGKHIEEWADVLAKVEEMVKVYARETGEKLEYFDGNSLEELSKNTTTLSDERITYLPSAQKALDGHLIRLRRKPDVFKRVMERPPNRARGECASA